MKQAVKGISSAKRGSRGRLGGVQGGEEEPTPARGEPKELGAQCGVRPRWPWESQLDCWIMGKAGCTPDLTLLTNATFIHEFIHKVMTELISTISLVTPYTEH